MNIKRVFCPVDFSDTSRKALRYAGAIATWYEAVLDVMHVVPDPAGTMKAVSAAAAADTAAQMRAAADAALQRFVDDADLSARYINQRKRDACKALRALAARDTRAACETIERVELGPPARTILRIAAELNADLLVMGAQSHGPSGVMLFGSTTQTALRRAACPVLTARAPAAIGDEP